MAGDGSDVREGARVLRGRLGGTRRPSGARLGEKLRLRFQRPARPQATIVQERAPSASCSLLSLKQARREQVPIVRRRGWRALEERVRTLRTPLAEVARREVADALVGRRLRVQALAQEGGIVVCARAPATKNTHRA